MQNINIVAYLILAFSLFACGENKLSTQPALTEQHYAKQALKAADIADDGQFSLISNNQQVCLWDNDKNAKVYDCISGPEGQLIELLGISKSKRYFYTSNRVNVHLYQLATGRMITVWSAGDNIINDIAFSENEATMILGFRNGQVSVIGVNNNKIETFNIHRLDINSVSLSADGKVAFTGASDKTAKLWHTDTGEVITTFTHQMRVNHVDMHPNGKIAFSLDAVDDKFFWNISSGKLFSELKSSARFIEFNHSQFSNNMQWLLAGLPKQKIQLWDTVSGKLSTQWQAYKHPSRERSSVLTVEFIDNNTIASITSDGVYQTWHITQ